MNVNKPPAFPLSHTDQNEYNFNINNMPWKQSEVQPLMMFSGQTLPNNNGSLPSTSGFFVRQPRVKRKSESDDLIPSKHFVSEEKMIAHMNGLHLSDNFQPHSIHLEDDDPEECNINLSPRELEQRLKSASRIIVCDEVKKTLQERSEIIPKALLNRLDKPCTAVILWRPPESLNLMTANDNKTSDSEEEGIEMDNNNNSMDMDL